MEGGDEKVRYTQGVKKKEGFWRSLEQYGWSVVRRSPLPHYLAWVGVGVIVVVISVSWGQARDSVVGARDLREVIERASGRGDYEMARELMKQYTKIPMNQAVLGANSELEDKVYPERVIERRITELETKLTEYPGNREILLTLAAAYGEIGESEKAQIYHEQARILDPNE